MADVKPWKLPAHHPEHLIWRLEYVSEDSEQGWYLLSGEQIKTIVAALRLYDEHDRTD